MASSKRARSEKSRTQPRDRAYVAPVDLQHALERIRQAACRDKELRFTSLWHHVYNIDRLRKAYFKLKRKAASGVDDVTWRQYGENLEDNLRDLSERLQRGAYRAKPVRRVYIPKADGRQRPLGVTALEDKIVQRSTVEVLNAIYETDFLGFFVRLSTRTQPASRAGCDLCRNDPKESKLGARCRHFRIFRRHRPGVVGEVPRASDRRPTRDSPH